MCLGIEVTKNAKVNTLLTNLACDICIQLKPSSCFNIAEDVCEHLHRREVDMKNVMLHQVLVADYTKVMEANVVIIFQIIVQAHQVGPIVPLHKRIQIAIQVINFKALHFFCT